MPNLSSKSLLCGHIIRQVLYIQKSPTSLDNTDRRFIITYNGITHEGVHVVVLFYAIYFIQRNPGHQKMIDKYTAISKTVINCILYL